MKSFTATLLFTLTLVFSVSAQSQNPCNPCSKSGTVFHFTDKMGRNTITFKSEAPLEDIIGTTNQITGHIAFDPNQPQKGGHGEFAVPVVSLNTGIPLRDEHLRGADWLHADQHANIKLKIIEAKNLKSVGSTGKSTTYEATLVTDFTLNGNTRRLNIPGRITYMKESDLTKTRLPGDLLAARAAFQVNLKDYGVTGPKGMNLIGTKVGESIDIEVSMVGASATGMMAGNPCNPCSGKANNPCNPCSGKANNPCNPCGKVAKKSNE